MFTGIIEAVGTIETLFQNGDNKTFIIKSPVSNELKVDQSLSHNGVCLTVEKTEGGMHQVTAIAETLKKTDLDNWQAGTMVNLERCLQMNGRIDGHLVQGHIDTTALCTDIKQLSGSTEFTFCIENKFAGLIIEKGSVALNGISLTIFNVTDSTFTVAIIPYTMEHTNMQMLQPGNKVNIEFDVMGKYILRNLELRNMS